MNCATENKVIALILKYPSMEKLLDNVSDEMLQEMIECYELEFPEPLDFKNRDTRRVICYSFILRLYTLRLDDCIAESNALFEILRAISLS